MDSRKLEKVILSWQKNDFILHQREKNKTREITTTAKQKEKSCYTVIYVQLQSRTVFVWSIAFSISTRILDRTCQCFIQFCYFLFLLFYLLIILFYFIFLFLLQFLRQNSLFLHKQRDLIHWYYYSSRIVAAVSFISYFPFSLGSTAYIHHYVLVIFIYVYNRRVTCLYITTFFAEFMKLMYFVR